MKGLANLTEQLKIAARILDQADKGMPISGYDAIKLAQLVEQCARSVPNTDTLDEPGEPPEAENP